MAFELRRGLLRQRPAAGEQGQQQGRGRKKGRPRLEKGTFPEVKALSVFFPHQETRGTTGKEEGKSQCRENCGDLDGIIVREPNGNLM